MLLLEYKKKCSKCGEFITFLNFSPTKRKYENKKYIYLRADCKECRQDQKIKYDENNKDKIKKYNEKYRKKNPGKIRSYYEKQQTI